MLRIMYRRACLSIVYQYLSLDRIVLMVVKCGLGKEFCIPLGLVGLKDLALCVVAQGTDIDETAQIELLGAEHRHGGRSGLGCR